MSRRKDRQKEERLKITAKRVLSSLLCSHQKAKWQFEQLPWSHYLCWNLTGWEQPDEWMSDGVCGRGCTYQDVDAWGKGEKVTARLKKTCIKRKKKFFIYLQQMLLQSHLLHRHLCGGCYSTAGVRVKSKDSRKIWDTEGHQAGRKLLGKEKRLFSFFAFKF